MTILRHAPLPIWGVAVLGLLVGGCGGTDEPTQTELEVATYCTHPRGLGYTSDFGEPPPIPAGGVAQCDVRIANVGKFKATGLSYEFRDGRQQTFAGATNCGVADNPYVTKWEDCKFILAANGRLPDLPAGQLYVINVDLTTSRWFNGLVTSEFELRASNDSVPARLLTFYNDVLSVDVQLLALQAPMQVAAGQTFMVEASIRNAGPRDFDLPSVSITSPVGAVVEGAETFTADGRPLYVRTGHLWIPYFRAGETYTVRLQVRLPDGLSGPVTVLAEIADYTADPVLDNNAAQVTIDVR